MQYAVIKTGSKQYRVNVGDKLTLDKLNLEDKKTIVFDQVMLLVTDGKVTLGKPTIKGAEVSAKLIEHKKGDKIRVAKYKAKSRYRRVLGFRPSQSLVQIEKIITGSKKNTDKSEKSARTAPKNPKK